VVATWTRTMQMFQQQVYLASSLAGYLELIEKALAEDAPERRDSRIAFAQSHTWGASVALIHQALNQAEAASQKKVSRPGKKTETQKHLTLSPQDYATANTPFLDQIAFIHKQEL